MCVCVWNVNLVGEERKGIGEEGKGITQKKGGGVV